LKQAKGRSQEAPVALRMLRSEWCETGSRQ